MVKLGSDSASEAATRLADGDTARVTALLEARDLPKDDQPRSLLIKILLDVELFRDRSRRLIASMVLRNEWGL